MAHLNDIAAADVVSGLASAELDAAVAAALGDVFPACAICVVHEGDVVVNRAWGWVDPQTERVAVTTDTRFDLASITKLYTSAAFMALVSAGKIGLDDRLVDVMPEFGASGPRPVDGGQDPHTKELLPVDPAYAGRTVDPNLITFRQLLTHTSGLAPWRDVYNAAGPVPAPPDEDEPMPRGVRLRNGLDAICAYPFVGLPGDRVRYSDLGLILLGEATSRLYGAPGALDAAIEAHVTGPLGLQTVGFNPVRNGLRRDKIVPTEMDDTWRKRRPWGEVHDENACGLGGVAGHASLFGAARDVAALGQAWLERDTRLRIKPALMDEAIVEHAETDGMRRGLGWLVKTRVGAWSGDLFSEDAFGHTGFTGTSLMVDPERRLVVALLTNAVYPGRNRPGIYEFRREIHTLLAAAVDSRR